MNRKEKIVQSFTAGIFGLTSLGVPAVGNNREGSFKGGLVSDTGTHLLMDAVPLPTRVQNALYRSEPFEDDRHRQEEELPKRYVDALFRDQRDPQFLVFAPDTKRPAGAVSLEKPFQLILPSRTIMQLPEGSRQMFGWGAWTDNVNWYVNQQPVFGSSWDHGDVRGFFSDYEQYPHALAVLRTNDPMDVMLIGHSYYISYPDSPLMLEWLRDAYYRNIIRTGTGDEFQGMELELHQVLDGLWSTTMILRLVELTYIDQSTFDAGFGVGPDGLGTDDRLMANTEWIGLPIQYAEGDRQLVTFVTCFSRNGRIDSGRYEDRMIAQFEAIDASFIDLLGPLAR